MLQSKEVQQILTTSSNLAVTLYTPCTEPGFLGPGMQRNSESASGQENAPEK